MVLLEIIEIKRNKMFETAAKYGFTDDKTVKCSQELDMLLNIYRKLTKSRVEKSITA
jgi:stage 0 sporulation regulatory protein